MSAVAIPVRRSGVLYMSSSRAFGVPDLDAFASDRGFSNATFRRSID